MSVEKLETTTNDMADAGSDLNQEGAMMTKGIVAQENSKEQPGKTYYIDIEGSMHEWHAPTITVAQIVVLGGWDASAGIIEVDQDNNERTLAPDEVVELKPGHGFAKKIQWKRGDSLFESRLDEELALLQTRYPGSCRVGNWFHLPAVPLPDIGWDRQSTDVVLRVQPSYPGTEPYAFMVPEGIRFKGQIPDNYSEPVGEIVPFPGKWGQFSWLADNGQWRPAKTVGSGSNLLNFAIGVNVRFMQGK
jgi:hypothetical protein